MNNRRDVTNTKRTRHVHKQVWGARMSRRRRGGGGCASEDKQALGTQVRWVLGSSFFDLTKPGRVARFRPVDRETSKHRACGPGAPVRMLVTSYDPMETHLDPADQCAYHLSRTLSAARAPPCGGLMTESGRVFACDVIVDDSSRVLCPAAARDRAIEEILELAAPGLERDARRPM